MSWKKILDQLEEGSVRAAYPDGESWVANVKVKEAILDAFKAGENVGYGGIYEGFVDKDNLPPRLMLPEDGVRLVPGGSAIRRGAFVAKGVILMPPAYVNIGAYVDEGTMVDSHALVGSCAQIGKNVHLSAGVQIGGVLEPVGLSPVVIEDDCFIGAGSVIVEGILVKKGAVIAPGVTLSKSVPVYDCVQEKMLGKGAPIPERSVVVPGTRPISSDWGKSQGLSVSCPIIIKYRDEGSDASLELEEALR
ncbi:2,3,4,5-tetrahydropyridine-2,6-dicarboxylate N-succinyltransferase [Rhodohalobacter sp. 8-1]|uniref:2,3,4,5-tetrahydropyridine-2,6-dicarboxylate N-succinyltransferase n=1 Tax=Rhodohalobacter sp. 8-1 TaxID=3131972 RepID=UPI0030EC65F1